MASPRENILSLHVPVVVRLGERSMPIKDVSELIPGAIIELPKNAEEELELLVNNRRIGRGTAVKVGENFGIQITSIGEDTERKGSSGPSVTAAEEEEDPAAMAERLLAGQL